MSERLAADYDRRLLGANLNKHQDDDAKVPHPQHPGMYEAQGSRQSAKSLLDTRIRQLENQINQLTTIKGMLPTHLTVEQDDALFTLINPYKAL